MPAELEWLLRRALGPASTPAEAPPDPALAVALAESSLLDGRIVRRTGVEILERELGVELGRRMEATRRNDAAVQLQYAATCRWLAERAAERGHPVIFLKGMALQLAGVVEAGDRPVADVDILVPAAAAEGLQGVLLEHGFRHGAEVAMRHPHHLPPLWSDRWLGVEVHDRLPGLAITAGDRFALAEDLLAHGLVEPVASLPAGAWVTHLAVTAVHMIAHALVHHPESEKFFFRLLGDLQAVLGRVGEERLIADSRLISWLVEEEEVRSLVDLVGLFAMGEAVAGLIRAGDPAAGMLGHFSALLIDPRYRRRVARSRLVWRDDPSDLSRRRRWPRPWWPRAETLGPDGRPLSWPSYLAWSLARPLRFATRILRAGRDPGGGDSR